MSVGQEVSRLAQDNYPTYAKRIIFIRSPAIFRMAWNIFRPFIDKSKKNKMIFSTEKDYRQVLEKYVDPKVLPTVLHPEGQGKAVDDFDSIWEGGILPDTLSSSQPAPPAEEEDFGFWSIEAQYSYSDNIFQSSSSSSIPNGESSNKTNNNKRPRLFAETNHQRIRKMVKWAFSHQPNNTSPTIDHDALMELAYMPKV